MSFILSTKEWLPGMNVWSDQCWMQGNWLCQLAGSSRILVTMLPKDSGSGDPRYLITPFKGQAPIWLQLVELPSGSESKPWACQYASYPQSTTR